jgi:hypothetical protein
LEPPLPLAAYCAAAAAALPPMICMAHFYQKKIHKTMAATLCS